MVSVEKHYIYAINPLMPSRYNCTYVLFLFLRSNCCKKLTLTLLTHESPKHTIVSIDPFLYKLNHESQFKAKLVVFYFCTLGTNGLSFLFKTLIC